MAKDLKDKRQNEVYNAKTMIKLFKKKKKNTGFSVLLKLRKRREEIKVTINGTYP